MTDHPRDSALEAENAALRRLLERVLTKEAMFGQTDKRLSIDIRNTLYPGWQDEPEDDDIEFKGDWAENRLLTSDLV